MTNGWIRVKTVKMSNNKTNKIALTTLTYKRVQYWLITTIASNTQSPSHTMRTINQLTNKNSIKITKITTDFIM